MRVHWEHFIGSEAIYQGGQEHKPGVVKYTCLSQSEYQVIYIGIWSERMSISLANGSELYSGRNRLDLFELICEVNGLTISKNS